MKKNRGRISLAEASRWSQASGWFSCLSGERKKKNRLAFSLVTCHAFTDKCRGVPPSTPWPNSELTFEKEKLLKTGERKKKKKKNEKLSPLPLPLPLPPFLSFLLIFNAHIPMDFWILTHDLSLLAERGVCCCGSSGLGGGPIFFFYICGLPCNPKWPPPLPPPAE